MANLVSLKEFDKQLAQTLTNLNKFNASINAGVSKKTWSREQVDDLTLLQYAVSSLSYALRDLVHNNRDGRG